MYIDLFVKLLREIAARDALDSSNEVGLPIAEFIMDVWVYC